MHTFLGLHANVLSMYHLQYPVANYSAVEAEFERAMEASRKLNEALFTKPAQRVW